MKKYIKKFLVCSIIFALVFSSYGINTSGMYVYADAASKPKVVLKLDKVSVSIEMGSTVALNIMYPIRWTRQEKGIV